MTTSLYLTIERHPRYHWQSRIARVSRRKPVLKKPSEQAIVKLEVDLPDNVFRPREVRVEIRPEHVVQPIITVKPTQP